MASLPSGYTELEYIESTGTQYILTDVIPNNDTYILAKVATTQSSQCGMVVCDENWQKNGCGFWGNAAVFGNQTIQDLQLYDGNPHTIEIQSGTITVDGSAVLTYAGPQFSGVCPLSICALNRAGVISEKTAMTVWTLVINDHQYVPCSTPANEVGLYDTEYGVFYGNNGSGSFIAGPEVSPPDTPENFYQSTSVVLKWSSVDCEGYKIYKNGALLTTTKSTQYVDSDVANGQDIAYSITAYRGNLESEPQTIQVSVREGYTILTPVITSAFFQ